MKTNLECVDARLASAGQWVLVCLEDAAPGAGSSRLLNGVRLSEIRAALEARGIALGEPFNVATPPKEIDSPDTHARLVIYDENGREHVITACKVEKYILSSGPTLFYLCIAGPADSYQWLVGKTVALEA